MNEHRRPTVPSWVARSVQGRSAATTQPIRVPVASGLARSLMPATGLGLDSDAVRTRMVQRLAAAGITSPLVLQAMGAVERHRFVDSALVNQA